jgi:hypothetical protein
LVIARFIFLIGPAVVVSNSVQKASGKKSGDEKSNTLTLQVSDLINQQSILVAQVNSLTDEGLSKLEKDLTPTPVVKMLPDGKLLLVYPEEAAVMICNEENAATALRPKYRITLADQDSLAGNLLQIPAQEGDFIRQGEAWGPNAAFGLPAAKATVKPGDRIFGYAMVL